MVWDLLIPSPIPNILFFTSSEVKLSFRRTALLKINEYRGLSEATLLADLSPLMRFRRRKGMQIVFIGIGFDYFVSGCKYCPGCNGKEI